MKCKNNLRTFKHLNSALQCSEKTYRGFTLSATLCQDTREVNFRMDFPLFRSLGPPTDLEGTDGVVPELEG